MRFSNAVLSVAMVLASAGIHADELPPITPVAHVDLHRFMGDWYVIATLPTRFEKNAFNAVESYQLQPDGTVHTGFRFRNGSYDGPVKAIHATGFVKPKSGGAVWGVQVFWPVKAQYIVAYLNDDYSQTIVARDARDYAWVMARTPSIPRADYDALLARVQAMGYPVEKVRKVPQRWPEPKK